MKKKEKEKEENTQQYIKAGRHVSTSYIPARRNCILHQKNKLKNIKYSENHIFQKNSQSSPKLQIL